ncbi:MAG: transcriptional regulator [Planctomycetota bacterium]|nr:MAG: transcriptional regulator [Planctomycetota bacterium]
MKQHLPQPVVDALGGLGADIRRARILRRWTVASLAQRAGISLSTMKAIEAGAPGTGIGAVARVLQLLGRLEGLAQLMAPGSDPAARIFEDQRLPKRVHPRKPPQKPSPKPNPPDEL